MKGKRITTMQQVFDAADARKALWFERWKRHTPAAILQCAGARTLQGWIDTGTLYEYHAKDHAK
jgi:hypothetical protein